MRVGRIVGLKSHAYNFHSHGACVASSPLLLSLTCTGYARRLFWEFHLDIVSATKRPGNITVHEVPRGLCTSISVVTLFPFLTQTQT